jgi:hypothetical protein
MDKVIEAEATMLIVERIYMREGGYTDFQTVRCHGRPSTTLQRMV